MLETEKSRLVSLSVASCQIFWKNVLVEDLAFYSAENTRMEDLILGIFC